MNYKFYDTSSLLLITDSLFNDKSHFAISSITLQELENIKNSSNKNGDVKVAARKLLHLLDEHKDLYDVIIYKQSYINPIVEKDLEVTNDTKILSCALAYDREYHPDEVIFVTNDLILKFIANLFFGDDSIESVTEQKDEYCGYKEVQLDEEQMIEFYQHPDVNHYNLKNNEYIIIYDTNNNIVDKLCWSDNKYRYLEFDSFNSKMFGNVKPIKDDPYQQLLFDCLSHNNLSVIRGIPGSGKSMIALAYLFKQLERGKIDNIVIFCNPVATRDSAKLG